MSLVVEKYEARWCAPCAQLGRYLGKVVRNFHGELITMDIEDNYEKAREAGVRGIPHLRVIKDGALLATHTGLLSEVELEQFLYKAVTEEPTNG